MRVYDGKVIHVHPLHIGGPPSPHVFEFMHIISDEHIHSLFLYIGGPPSPHIFKSIQFWDAADIDSDE